MRTRRMQPMARAAGVAWLVVAAYGVLEMLADDGGWEVRYAFFTIALMVGAALAVTVTVLATTGSARPRLRAAGIAVSGLGGVACIVAWALPLWMGLLGAGFALLAGAAGAQQRRAVVTLAAGQLVGIVVLIAGIEAELGRADEYGDYPVAGGVAVAIVGAAMAAGLLALTNAAWRLSSPGSRAPDPDRASPTH